MNKTVALTSLLLLGTSPVHAEVEILPLPSNTGQTQALPQDLEMQSRRPRVESLQTQPARVESHRPADTPVRDVTPPPPAPSPVLTTPTTAPHPARPAPKSRAAKTAQAPSPQAASTAAFGDARLFRYNSTVQPAIQAFDEGRYEESSRILKGAWEDIVSYGDVGMMALLGFSAMRTNDEETALRVLKEAADLTEDDEFYKAQADALLYFHHADEAEQVLNKMSPSPERDQLLATLAIAQAQTAYESGRYADAETLLKSRQAQLDPGGLELLGWIQYRLGKLDDAAQSFATAYRAHPSQGSAQGLSFTLHRLQRYDTLLTIAAEKPGPLDELLPTDVRTRIADGGRRFGVDANGRLNVAASTGSGPEPGLSVRVEPKMRDKYGNPGEGKLLQRGVEARIGWEGERDSLSLNVERQRADNRMDSATGERFYGLWRHRDEQGFEYRFGLGRTLSGGAVDPAFTGEIGAAYHTPDWGLGLRAFRRGNEESLLALSGHLDPTNGLRWGRVMETGLTLDGRHRIGSWQALGALTAASVTGQNVADNRKLEFYGQALHPVPSLDSLQLGPEVYASAFEKNLSAFEPGHGGYFSPKSFVKLGALARYEAHLGELDLSAQAGLGWGWSRQDAAPGNPLTGAEPEKYAASRSNGVAYHGQVDARWSLNSHWQLGFNAGGQKSPDYTDWRAGLYALRRWND